MSIPNNEARLQNEFHQDENQLNNQNKNLENLDLSNILLIKNPNNEIVIGKKYLII